MELRNAWMEDTSFPAAPGVEFNSAVNVEAHSLFVR